MKQIVLRYVISSAITFLSTFSLIFGANFAMTGDTVITGSIITGIAMVAWRGGVKAVLESIVKAVLSRWGLLV